MAESFSKVAMEVVVSVILLCAVAIPILNGMPAASGQYADIINMLLGIIPIILAVAIILGVVYGLIIKNRD